MCKNATEQISNLMVAVRPTLASLMQAAGVATDVQVNTLKAFDAAQEQLAAWTPGTTSQSLIEALNAALSVVQALQSLLPPGSLGLLGIVVSSVEAVIALVAANSTTNKDEQEQITKAAIAKVKLTVPHFDVSIIDKGKAALGDTHVAANHYKHEWDKQVEATSKVDAKYAALKYELLSAT